MSSLIPHLLPRRPPANWQTPLKLNVPFPLIFVQFFSPLVFLLPLIIGFFQGNWPSTFLAISLWLLQHWPRRLCEQPYKTWGGTFMGRFKTASCPWKAIELYLIGNHWKPLSKALPTEPCVFSCHWIYLSVFLTSTSALHTVFQLLLPVKTGIPCSLSALWFVWNLPRQQQPYRIGTSPHHPRNSNQAQQKKNFNYLHNKNSIFIFLNLQLGDRMLDPQWLE